MPTVVAVCGGACLSPNTGDVEARAPAVQGHLHLGYMRPCLRNNKQT